MGVCGERSSEKGQGRQVRLPRWACTPEARGPVDGVTSVNKILFTEVFTVLIMIKSYQHMHLVKMGSCMMYIKLGVV